MSDSRLLGDVVEGESASEASEDHVQGSADQPDDYRARWARFLAGKVKELKDQWRIVEAFASQLSVPSFVFGRESLVNVDIRRAEVGREEGVSSFWGDPHNPLLTRSPQTFEGRRLEFVSSGSIAHVYRVEGEDERGRLAVKTFQGLQVPKERWLYQIEKIYRCLALPGQPCVPAVFGACLDWRCPLVITELIEGTQLSKDEMKVRLKPEASAWGGGGEGDFYSSGLSFQEAGRIATVLTEAVSMLHEKEKVLVDLKPENVVVRSRDKMPFIVDVESVRGKGESKSFSKFAASWRTTPADGCLDVRHVFLTADPEGRKATVDERLKAKGLSFEDVFYRIDTVPLLLCLLRLFGGDLTGGEAFEEVRDREYGGLQMIDMQEHAVYVEHQHVKMPHLLKELCTPEQPSAGAAYSAMGEHLKDCKSFGDFLMKTVNLPLELLPTSAQVLVLVSVLERELAGLPYSDRPFKGHAGRRSKAWSYLSTSRGAPSSRRSSVTEASTQACENRTAAVSQDSERRGAEEKRRRSHAKLHAGYREERQKAWSSWQKREAEARQKRTAGKGPKAFDNVPFADCGKSYAGRAETAWKYWTERETQARERRLNAKAPSTEEMNKSVERLHGGGSWRQGL
uniref:Protein kinase domain-containing protein n=1 Tax=Chromera velia CCMP2878 TaxID=1169474 RepID=A0A0G4GZY0_9ALVE|eukprot:Cvel_24055.t1-p1 / transcript=Cvel_24055.t1 / gene=Cvel_24055 / organism=Chromera_velia_CCMP2878 / gene_product=hypothetical protein / transcript_product=hypothetical protein / location=Cvel_scaffold2558:23544-26410(-) / protein_length=625 / sequence_SO=supercontig / SO=protein_coding / is_pseudo=false